MKHNSLMICLAVFGLLLSSCATQNPRGTIKISNDVTSIFWNAEVNPDYNYFYHGVYVSPDTIMGIDKTYTVQSKFWTAIDLDKEELQKLVTAMNREPVDHSFASSFMGRFQGAYVLDPDGKTIGMWYSKKDLGTFEFLPDNIVIPYPPQLKGFQRERFSLMAH